MSIRFDSILKNADGTWVFAWSETGNFRVVLYGIELTRTSASTYLFSGIQGFDTFPPPLEVVPAGELALSEQFKPYVVIQWYRDADAATYLIQKSPDGSSDWVTVGAVHESGQWVYTYRSPVLDDVTTYHWQVIAESVIGNQSMARKYDAYVVTPPRPVDSGINVQYSGGNVVVSGA